MRYHQNHPVLIRIASIMFLVASLIACSKDRQNLSPIPSIDPQVKMNLNAPVKCSSARQDIETLERERASVGKQILSGVRSILPISVVAGILMGDYSDRFEVASGQYNSDIGVKIEQIRSVCKIK